MSTRNLRSLAKFLSTLGLDTNRIPSVSEFRTAYKGFFHLHPDKAGPDSNDKFQEITEAAKEVFEFLTTAGNIKLENVSDDDPLACLVKNSNLQFNKKCVTFDISADSKDEWMEEFERVLGPSKPLNNNDASIQFKMERWCLDSDTGSSLAAFGSVSVNFYPTTLKIMVQGSAYLDFTTFAIPKIVEKLKKVGNTAVENDSGENTKKAVVATDMVVKDDNSNTALIEGFRRMESAVVEMRTDIIRRVDESVVNAHENRDDKMLNDIVKKLDRLDNLLEENKSEMAKINEKLTVLTDKNTVNLEPTAVQAIAAAVSENSDTRGKELEDIATTINEIKHKLDDKRLDEVALNSRKVLEKMDGVKELSDSFTSGLDKLDKIFETKILREVATNSEKSVSALNNLNSNMEKFLAKFDTKSNTIGVSKETDIEAEKEAETNKEKRRKGKLFSSSVALGCNKEKLQIELDCDLEVVETYHINENITAADPEKYLDNMIKSHLKPGEVDFIIISVGGNDISFLNSDKSEVDLNKEAIEQSSVLAEIAYQAGEKFGIDVFVTVRPARYDKKEKDSKGVKSKLNKSANGMQVALISVLDKVHNVHLPALENLSERAKKDLFKNDGIHLTKAGLCALEDDLVHGIRSVYTDIKVTEYKSEAQHINDADDGREGAGRPGRHDPGRHGPGGHRHHDRDRQAGGDYGRRQPPDQPRQPNRNWRGNSNNNNNQMYRLQNMMRDFMFYMDKGPDRYGGRGRY